MNKKFLEFHPDILIFPQFPTENQTFTHCSFTRNTCTPAHSWSYENKVQLYWYLYKHKDLFSLLLMHLIESKKIIQI